MQWELISTWIGLAVTVGTGIYKMGKQSQKISDLESEQADLKQKVEANREIPVELAILKTDVKYLIQGMGELKQLILNNKVKE